MTPYYQREGIVIYHGDCLEIMPRLIEAGVKCDMAMTDPPYGHNNNNGDLIHKWEEALGRGPAGEARAIANDGVEANEIYRLALPMMRDMMASGGCCCCCCGGGGPDPQFARWSLWMDEVFDFKQMIVWDKGPMGMGWHYRRSYETVLVGQKRGAACRWFDTSNRIENIIRPDQCRKIIPKVDDHPTPKPVGLAEHFIKLHTELGHVVLDPFTGHGWVGVAAIRLGRGFIGIEIDAGFCAIAAKRCEEEFERTALIEPAMKLTQAEMFE